MPTEFISNASDEKAQYKAAERFVRWLEEQVVSEARGEGVTSSDVNPDGKFWLGRLGPKDFVTLPDDRQDRLEPCAIGLRIRPRLEGPWSFHTRVTFSFWSRQKSKGGGQRWDWQKSDPISLEIPISLEGVLGEYIFGADVIAAAFVAAEASGLTAEVRVRVGGRSATARFLEITFVNTSPEIPDFANGRFFECEIAVTGPERRPFQLESLPDSFRYNRDVEAYGINCGFVVSGAEIRTSDATSSSRPRPNYWSSSEAAPDLKFKNIALDPLASSGQLARAFEDWASENWSDAVLESRAGVESWSKGMRDEAARAALELREELDRVKRGRDLLVTNERLRTAFVLMNKSMEIAARGKYEEWRPFQFAFLLANLQCLENPLAESDIVDVVWFATGGGKTETYLGLLLTAAFMDRMRGKLSGVTAWSRFPLRMLSLQQTQRFANAIAAAEVVRRQAGIDGDPFSLGFLVGGSSTPNRVLKESENPNEDADKIAELENPFRLLDVCPFCAGEVTTQFERSDWRLTHRCSAKACASDGEPLPIHVVDDEIWRFLPTVVIGTLDKAANIARHTGMRGLVGAPRGKCTKAGHGYTYGRRHAFPNGCLVPDCKGGDPGPLPIASAFFAPSFRLQDELHLLRDSLGAVDAHYECTIDGIQEELNGSRPKILASSATLSGYQKQIEVLYRRKARVFPQPPPVDGKGFWTSASDNLMRRYVALAPRRLTVEFVVDRLVVCLQRAVRHLVTNPGEICSKLAIDPAFAPFLVNLYGTNVVYGNTLQDIDAVVRSSETQYAELDPPPNVETLTGRTDFDNVREILRRLERPEEKFEDRLHLVAASSMMSHGVDIDRLNVMIMLAFPLGIAEFIQATARVGRRWPALVIVIPKMTRERDASVYRSFPQFVSHGDRFVEPIPITRKSRRVLERTISGMELARINLIHEPSTLIRLTTPKGLNAYIQQAPDTLASDKEAIAADLGIAADDDFMQEQLNTWFEGFARNLREPPADVRFLSDLCPTGNAMTSLRDVEEQAPVKGDSTK